VTVEKNRPAQQGMPALEQLKGGPRTAVSAAVAKRLFRAAVARLEVTVVEETTGRRFGQGGPLMRLHRPEEFYARLGRDGLIGFGEAYMTGAWDTDDLAGFLTVPAARIATLIPEPLQRLRAFVTPRLPSHHRSTEANSQANISHHYDLSNDLFALFLDETLSYSSALFDTSITAADPGNEWSRTAGDHLVATPPEPTDNRDPLLHNAEFAAAQANKIERLLDAACVTDGSMPPGKMYFWIQV
jgi:cyclopropane-fatty-acyl-phospholipid synthase